MGLFSSQRMFWRVALGLVVTAVCTWLVARGVQWADVLAAWQQASVVWLVVGVCCLVGSWYVSAHRWVYVLRPAPGLRAWDTFSAIMIGFLANSLLPFRLGDVARATVVAKNKGMGFPRTIGSMACERIFDLFVLVGLTFTLLRWVDVPVLVVHAAVSLAMVGGLLLMVLLVLLWHQRGLDRLEALVERWVPRALAARVREVLVRFLKGVELLRYPRRAGGVLVLSLVQWGLAGVAVWFWLQAFSLAVPWYACLFVLVMINLGAAIPSAPGYVGVYHYLAVLALLPWGVDRSEALAYALGTHALNILANVVLGAYFLSAEGLSLRKLRASTT